MNKSKWDKFLHDLENHPYLRKLIQIWYWNSKEETDDFNKFIYAWISFEAFASNYTEENLISEVKNSLKNDKKINNFFSSLMQDQSFSKNVLELEKCYRDWETRKRHSKDLEFNKKIENTHNFVDVLEILYKVRNNLYCVGKRLDLERDRKLSLLSFKILNKLLEKVFSEANIK